MTDVLIAGRNPLRLCVAGRVHEVAEQAAGQGAFALVIDGATVTGWRYRAGDAVYLRIAGRSFTIPLSEPTAAGETAASSTGELRAPLPGTVVDIAVSPGASVRRGDTLLTIESMKVQMALPSPRDGVVAAVHVAVNTAFERDTLLVALLAEV
jgi:3-methylcrotonyl-CoA carboxylase alpha subunit